MNQITCPSGHPNPSNFKFCSTCGMALPLSPGTKLRAEKYEIISLLGKGGFGRTYLANDTGRRNEKVAIKEFSPSVKGTNSLLKAQELFNREAEILYRLNHPQIPKFWESFSQDKRLFLVQEYITGKTYQTLLSEKISQGQIFQEKEILALFHQLLPVLAYLHSQGIIHRDIAPDNIMQRSTDHQPILIDFGAVKELALNAVVTLPGSGQINTLSNTAIQKMGFSPDEQFRGIVTPNSDLYALAATALSLMTGKAQPTVELRDPLTGEWLWQKQLNLNHTLTKALNKMLDLQPDRRFQSATEVIQFLQEDMSLREVASRSLLTGSISWLVAISIFTGLGTIWLTSVFWLLIFGGLSLVVLAKKRPLAEKIYWFSLGAIATLIIGHLYFFFWGLNNPLTLGIKGVIIVIILAIMSGAIILGIITLSKLISK